MMKKLVLLAANEHRLPMVPATTELAAKLDGVLERAKLGAAGSRSGSAPRRKTAAR